MRLLPSLSSSLLVSLAITTAAIELPYFSTLSLPISLQDYFPPTFTSNTTAQAQRTTPVGDLRRRGGSQCPNDFHACTNLGAPGLCCANAAICTPDENGNVACCPSNVVCTGVVTGAITSGTVNTDGSLIGKGTGTAGGTATSSGNAGAGTTSNGVVIQSNSPANSPTASSSAGEVIVGGGGGGGSSSGALRGAELPLLARVFVSIFRALAF